MTEITQALVVDDSRSARYSLKKMLSKQGIDTLFAESAGAALNLLETAKPDVIFMDHLMPGMDGFEATKAIKANPRTTTIPIVMCTSREGADYEGEAIMNGASAILPKPAPEGTLIRILTNLIEPVPPTQTEAAPDNSHLLETLTDTLRPALASELQDSLQSQVATLAESLNSALETRLSQKVGQLFEDQQEEQLRIINTRTAKLQQQLIDTLNEELDGKIKYAVRQQFAERKSDEELVEQISDELKTVLTQQLKEELVSTLLLQEQAIMDAVHKEHQALLQTTSRAQMVGTAGIAVGVSALIAALVL
ncbi:response regulator [Sansalvadorimonas verongulae]|uniref:response regulator n=1 Tax=Sansalvadorimonas verongulae TaxID=2172824 RepID=UPI0012BB62AC|nr:response regulator [Sansalvadorimonas verongulae]MTI12645.1 response regulator [Sansalvadorimonas verongulae]